MYYRLKEGYALRGWKGTTWVLVHRPDNHATMLEQDQFQALILCDGETDLSDVQLNETLQRALRQCEAQHWIQSCTAPGPLDADQYYRYYKNRYVRSVFWSMTGRCNFRCRHCYMDAPSGLLGELSTQQALDLIDQMAACGVLRVDLSGGEPFVRKDFWQLLDRILSYKIVVDTIYTNGWLVNSNLLDQFEKRGIKPNFSVSFDGLGWHDWMRGVAGAEQAALRALQLLHQRGYATDVEMCVHRGNVNSLAESIEALRSVGVQYLKASNVAATPLWLHNSQGNTLSDREYIESILPYIAWYYKAGQPLKRLGFAGVITMEQGKGYHIAAEHNDGTEACLNCFLCNAVRNACYITPEGRLLPCMPMTASPVQDQFPLVQEIGLEKGLSDSYFMQFVSKTVKDLLESNPECQTCDYRYWCGGGCRANALLEGDQNLMGCDRTMCMLWKGGYAQRIRQAAADAVRTYAAGLL